MLHAQAAFAGLDKLVQSQALPREVEALRLPTFPAIERTSVLSLTATSSSSVAAASSSLFAVVRDPCYPVWATYPSSVAGYVGGMFGFAGSGPYLLGESLDLTTAVAADGMMAMVSATAPFNGSLRPVIASAYGGPWIYVPVYTYCVISFAYTGTWNAVNAVTLQVIPGFNKDDAYNSISYATAMGTMRSGYMEFGVISPGGWIRPTSLIVTTAGTVAPTFTSMSVAALSGGNMVGPTACTSPYMYPLIPNPPEFANSTLPYQGSRLNALSVLFSNTTSVMNKEGTVEALFVRTSGTKVLSATALPTFFAGIAADTATSGRYFGLLEKGIYTYAMPDQLSSSFLSRTTGVSALTPNAMPLMDLDGFAYCNLIHMVDYGSPGTTLAITVDSILEFRNTTMLWPIGYSAVTLEAWHQAQLKLMSVGVFFENTTHAKQIKSKSSGGNKKQAQQTLQMGPKAMQVRLTKPQVITRSPSVDSRRSRGSRSSRTSRRSSKGKKQQRKARQR